MFRTRFSFPFSRIFRLRRRRAAKADANSADVARASYSGPPPPSKSRRPVSSRPEPINTTPTPPTRRRSLFISLLSPITQSPLPTSPDVTPLAGTPPPVLLIGQDLPQTTLPLPPAPAPPVDVGPQIPVDGVSLLESPPVSNTRRVSFQLPTTDTDDRPATPLSTCSTLVSEAGAQPEVELALAVRPEQPLAPEAGSIGAVPAEPVAELPSVARSGSGRARPISLFNPQPVRVDVSRFSLPVAPTVPIVAADANARYGRRESKRTSFISRASGSGSTKEKRTTRWSRELNKPETQEVLRVLRGL